MNKLQDYTHSTIPENAGPRFGALYLATIELSVAVCVPVFMFGAALGQQLQLSSLILALALGGVMLTLMAGFSSYIGARTRLTTALLAQASFGHKGAKAVWIILAMSMFGWFGVQTELFATSFISFSEKIWPSWKPAPLAVTVISGLLMSTTSIVGIRAIGRLAIVCTPLLIFSMIYALYQSWESYPAGTPLPLPATPTPFGLVLAAIIGGYAVGVVVMPDVKRFARSGKTAIIAAGLSLGIGYPLLLLTTAMTTIFTHQQDLLAILLTIGFGPAVLIILMLATWTSNDVNLYGASLPLSNLFPNHARWKLTALAGILGTTIATFGIFSQMMNIFILLGVLSTPILAVYGYDYIFQSSRFSQSNLQNAPAYRWTSFGAWIAGSIYGIAATPASGWGWGVTFIPSTGVPPLDSLAVSAILCALLSHFQRRSPYVA